jgi:predicted enzyme related to lactoylglutathione lyase
VTLAPALDAPSAPRISERGRTGDQVLLEVDQGAGVERCLLVTIDASGRIARILDCTNAAVAERDMRRRAAGGGPDAPEPPAPVSDLVPFVHVADIGRSIAFYELLGLRVCETYEPAGRLVWAHLRSQRAALMLALAEEPVTAREQGVLFYLYTPDLAALRDHLVAAGAGPGQIVDGSPGPREELRIDDPDGYRLMIAQLDDAPG